MKAKRDAGLVFLAAFLLLSRSAGAQSPPDASVDLRDADSLLRVAVPRTLKNRQEAMAYTYQIDYRNRNFTERGKPLVDYSARYEVIFVGGLPYRRLTEENRKPLAAQQAAEEESRYERAFEERGRMSIDQKRDYLNRPWNVDFPLPQLAGLFANRIVGDDAVDGRAAIVVESVPRADVQPVGEEELRALHKQVKLWIDREDLIVSRIEATLVADDAAMKKGTRARIEFVRKDGVYLPAESDVRFETMDGSRLLKGETEERNRDFHKFRVDVRLLTPPETAGDGHPAQ